MKYLSAILLFSFIYPLHSYASEYIASVFLNDAITHPVCIYKSSTSSKIIGEIRESKWLENWHEVHVIKIRKKRFYAVVEDIGSGSAIKGWIRKEDCAVYLNGAYVDGEKYLLRFYNNPQDNAPTVILTGKYSDGGFDDLKSLQVIVTDVCSKAPVWLRVRIEYQDGRISDVWTYDYCANAYGSCESPPAERLW